MSATLGPIHHLMHERLLLAADRQQDLADFAWERMSPGQRDELEGRWTFRHRAPAGDLGALIGDHAIHAWIQHQLESQLLSEYQLWALLGDRPERAAQVRGRLLAHGRSVGAALLAEDPLLAGDARRVLGAVDRVLLVSMPCDPVSQVVAAGERGFIVRRDLLVHGGLWARAGLGEEEALAGQESWLRGLLEALPAARFTRAEVTAGGRRLFDDRCTLVMEA